MTTEGGVAAVARAGAVWVDVLPNMSRFSRELGRQVSEPVVAASRQAGEDGGEAAAGGMREKLKTGAAAVGVAAGAALTAGLMTGLEGEQATAKLKAQLGLTGKDAQRAGKAAGQLYADAVTGTIEEGASAVGAIMSAGLAPEKATTKQLAAIATKVQDVSTLFETDLAQTANAVGQVMKTGLAKDSKEALDVITRGFQTMGPRADDLMDTLNEYSTIFRSVGLDAKTAVGLMAQGMAAGARDTDVVADAVKEFTIEAVAGGERVKGGFKTLGLDAGAMVSKFAKGGPTAAKAFDTVLDKLRDIEDPAKRNSAAIELFGTKAEDMGDALFALDPSKAAAELGRVGGAANKAGDDLRDNTAVEFEQFKRRALMGLSAVVMNDVLPAMKAAAPVVASMLAPVRALWGWLQADPARMQATVAALLAVGGAIAAFKIASMVVGGVTSLVGGITRAGAMARTAGGHIRFAAFAVRYYAVIGTQSAVAAVRAGAAWAAGAARASGAWAAARARAVGTFIATQASAAATALRTSVTWAVAAVRSGAAWAAMRARAVGAFAATAVSATVSAARTATAWVVAQTRAAAATARATLTLVAQRTAMVAGTLATKAMAAGQWLLNAALRANPIGIIITLLIALGAGLVLAYKKSSTFRAIVQGAMRGVVTAVKAVGAAGVWLWKTALLPAFRGIGIGVRLLKTAAATAFGGISTAAKWMYNKGVKPAIDAGKRAAAGLGAAFARAKDVIGEQFGKIKSLAKKPIAFIVNTVYNNGIVALWSKIRKAFGGPELHKVNFARGGIMPGYTPGRDVHHFTSPTGGRLALSGGEAIMRPEFTRGVGARAIGAWNAIARTRGARGVRAAMSGGGPVQAFKDGGMFGWVGDAASAVKGVGSDAWEGVRRGASWLKDSMAASARGAVKKLVNPLLDKIPGLDTGWGEIVKGVPLKIVDALVGYSEKADDKIEKSFIPVGGVGGGVKRWTKVVLQALRMVGQPASLLGITLRRMNQESGGNPRAINNWDVNAKRGDPSRGLMQTIGSTFNAYAGRLRKRGIYDPLANVYASMRYALSVYGSLAKAYNRPGGYASGGRPRPGEIAWVGERGPELVRFGGGDSEVFDHRTSLRMAAGVSARGFAKGTAGAKARRELPGDLKAWTKALSGSTSQIKSAAKALSTDLRAAGGAGKRLAKSTDATARKLTGLAGKRDAVAKKIAAANTYIGEQRTAAADYTAISQLGESASVMDVISGLKTRQGTTASFQKSIAALKKKGLNNTYLRQLIGMGPESGLAGVLAGAGAGQITALNSLAKSGAKLSDSYGRTMGDYLYDAGSQAGKGILAGLKAQEKALQAQMNKLGAGMVKAIKRSLKIKSPSRVTRDEVGAQVGAGVIEGMADMLPGVRAEADRMAAATVPGRPLARLAASSGAAAGPGGGLGTGPLYLVVEDGTVLRAWVDERVDGALTEVRARGRAGAKT
ncbi:phage tail tape measure protein [Streptomyces sp. LNU-CPARS28]|uniref:phage tail tape measure protein n=1 Tax=Streptomyces sp. LNU-CPARS28 TaxID=3137371 RepID=UPI0031359E6A